MAPIITLTTDFGQTDGYHGVLEGVIAGINPAARIISISHDVPPGDITGGWYLLKTHSRYFPPGSIHLAVVDPGVGSKRKIVIVRAKKYWFIAPDNGLLSFLSAKDILSVHSITNRKYALSVISPVFHGRDIMAPAAAYASLGVDPACLGRKMKSLVRLDHINPRRRNREIIGRVIWIDRFGNLISNIEARYVSEENQVLVNGESVGKIKQSFSDVRSSQPLAYIGSGGHLEIAVRDGSAQEFFHCPSGMECEIRVA